jgi:hypothetical protein
MPLNPTYAQMLVSKLKEIDEPRDLAIEADRALNFLLKQLEELRVLANGYPRNPISGSVWTDGKALTEICDELTGELDRRNQAERQEFASRLSVGMACQVMGHYPEEIFPRVVRNGRCCEAIHAVENAIKSYEAVVQDFSILDLEEILEEIVPIDEDEGERFILAAVREALERLLALQPQQNNEERQELLRKIEIWLGTGAP